MVALSRRQLLMLAGISGVSSAFAGSSAAVGAVRAAGPVAAVYREALHLHTRWVEEQWDDASGAYRGGEFRFISVLGNAVLLGMDDFDAGLAGVDAATLRARTVATIKRFAASNRLAGGSEWGRLLFWDSTFELYFVLAARLMWADLDPATRVNVQRIAEGQAAYAYELNTQDDPMSAGFTPNGTAGGWKGDSRLAAMGAYAQALVPGTAWTADPESAESWRERFLFWASNASALPVADRANPAVVDGDRIDQRTTAHNIHDSFIVESDGSVSPDHQAELWRTAGRSAIHFLVAGQPVPEILTRQPSGEQLWRTLRLLASDAGEPVMPMATERYHLYGRDVLALAFLAQVAGDRDAARAEADLAERLLPYVRHEPEFRLVKFGAEESEEPVARAEVAVAYLFHRLRKTPVAPVSKQEFFRSAAGTRDFGRDVGLTVHQSPAAFAAAVTKPEFARFLWQPGHDNWLVDARVPAFLPAGAQPTERWTRAYRQNRDGVDATATVLAVGGGYAGFTTLPTGTVVYASTGLPGEGTLALFTMAMPGVPGLTGRRTFTFDGGRAELGDQLTGSISFSPRDARYVRMLGREPATTFGYSIYTFEVLDVRGADLAQGAMPTASSEDVWYPARNTTDGNPLTRWTVAAEERGRADSWLAVDLGLAVRVAGVRIHWEAAYAKRFVIQTSIDGLTWTDAAAVPETRAARRWVGIDGRAGLVTHGGNGKITVTAAGISAPAPLIEGYAGSRRDLAAAATRALPAAEGLSVSDADGYLSLFNLAPDPVRGVTVRIPSGSRLYRGTQVVTGKGSEWEVSLEGGTARVEPPRFTVEGAAPAGTRFEVHDSHHVTVTAPRDNRVRITLRCGSWSAAVRLASGRSRRLTVPGGPVTPTADLARGRTTFPTSPLPEGMTSPDRAVDGDPATSWRPGAAGRMVVDLGSVTRVRDVDLTWGAGHRRPHRIEASQDGLTYAALGARARYVAVVVDGWRPGDADLVEFAVR
ncbi:discoidin domain-containing protein [Couchioplanes caeruleus]|uniref:discoidin domain-containing protein n=1 Tax=Couchioplanes caeruleus TaxID=56438 RepID=UPI0020BDBCA1|nr:discoidin domain-containing protein [Couchioplanes caeruleus]UQU64404.1 discoidin domain-containing protein [Couchioplanes caeruleus]